MILSSPVTGTKKKHPLLGCFFFCIIERADTDPGSGPRNGTVPITVKKGTYRCEKGQITGISLEKTPVKDYNVNYGFVCSAQANVSLWIRREAITLSRKTIPEKIHFVCCILKSSREGGILCAIEFTMSA